MNNNLIITGSRAFFDGVKGFKPHDNDYVCFVNKDDASFDLVGYDIKPGECIFNIVNYSKNELIEKFLNRKGSTFVCFFLVPEIISKIGLTIGDLKRVKPIRDKLNGTHTYLGIIYDAYIENNSFTLTNEQLEKAYDEYVKSRMPKTEEELAKIKEESRKKALEKMKKRMLERQQRANEINQ